VFAWPWIASIRHRHTNYDEILMGNRRPPRSPHRVRDQIQRNPPRLGTSERVGSRQWDARGHPLPDPPSRSSHRRMYRVGVPFGVSCCAKSSEAKPVSARAREVTIKSANRALRRGIGLLLVS